MKLGSGGATGRKTSDFRRRTSVESGRRCMRRPCGRRVARSRKSDVPNRGSGTLAASALARHCEATRVSLPREERPYGNVQGPVEQGYTGRTGILPVRKGATRRVDDERAGSPFSQDTLGCSVDCSCCWLPALNDERQRSELRTDDRRQRTEDGGCMSLCMLQPSSFVFCPLSFVLSTPQPETRN